MPIPKSDEGTTSLQRQPVRNNGHVASTSDAVRWSPLLVDNSRYCIVILQGPDQTGKTHLALTAPAPILIMTFDPANLRGVAKKFAGTKDIQVASFEMPKGLVPTSALAKIAKAEATRYTDTFAAAVEGAYFKTIVMDREDEAWELYRYEEFQGEASAKPHHYVQLNMAYKAMLKSCEKHKKNLIMIDAIKEEYKANKPTGETKRVGFNTLGMLSQVNLECMVDSYDNFSVQVIRCRDDATKNGVVITRDVLDAALLERLQDRPSNPVTGEPDWYHLQFDNIMSYLIGGKPEEWR